MLCVIFVQIAYRDTSHIVGDHRVPEVLFRGSSQQQQRDGLNVLRSAAAMQADTSPMVAATYPMVAVVEVNVFAENNDLIL